MRYEVNAVMLKVRSSYPPAFSCSQHVVVPCAPLAKLNAPPLSCPFVSISFSFFSCYPKGCAAPGEVPCQCNTRRLLSKLKKTLPRRKIGVTSKSPFGDISVVTLIRTDTTLDHSQKAEKVCLRARHGMMLALPCAEAVLFVILFFPCACVA